MAVREHTTYSSRGDAMAGGPLTNDRLASLERNVDGKFSEIARVWSALGERLHALENAITAPRAETSMPAGFDELGSTLEGIGDRIAGLERQLTAKSSGGGSVNLQPVMERLTALERLVTAKSAGSTDLSPLFERLQAIDTRVTEVNRGASTIVERIAQFERKLDSGAGSADRLRAIEEAVTAQRNQVAQLTTNISAEVKALGQTLATQGSSGDKIQSLTSAFERQRGEMATAITQPLTDRVGHLSNLIDSHRKETAQNTGNVSDKIGALEKLMQSFGQRTLDLHAAHGKDLVELHDALVKLNTNQQTLAASMDQWRLDNGTEIGKLTNRFEGIERTASKPVQMLESLQSNMLTLQRTTAKRDEQRGRFRQWLMGTDDWYGASWEEAEAKDRQQNGKATTSGPTARPPAVPGTARNG